MDEHATTKRIPLDAKGSVSESHVLTGTFKGTLKERFLPTRCEKNKHLEPSPKPAQNQCFLK